MTKVYLVYMEGIDNNNRYRKQVWAVFTNKRKAQIYSEYKKENTDETYLLRNQMKSIKWVVEEKIIWTEDYTSRLNQIQIEKLPY